MLWAIDRTRRRKPLRATRRQLVRLTKRDAEMLCFGSSHFGDLKAFSFECPGLGC
jgi:hypothetical protein